MTEAERLARQVNLRVPALLTSALEHSRSMPGSETAERAERDFRATVADLPDEVSAEAIAFALARYAAQMVDQLSVAAGMDAESVIQHFAATYLATMDD
ncbi:hypothetical protein K8F61_05080 [Microbacterium resistens]|uniref:MftR C-terminal domain-containing protein n=1 Tax=Microbacterium resistens TaxID=156977 RepID=A0ABY3RX86_9MICO|nr:hypothetical protein [Microbacterium resistens]UGS27563.1 hypothetical protein K8F61_05080 [Microbacterium resistens]